MITENAIISLADIDIERCLTFWIHLSYRAGGQGYGGYYLGGSFGCVAIQRLLEVVGVQRWSELQGKCVRVRKESPLGDVLELGHFLEDKWLNLSEISKKYRNSKLAELEAEFERSVQ